MGERVAIALGSNLGNRQAQLLRAVAHLRSDLSDMAVSDFLETDPIDVGAQPLFLNGAVVGGWHGTARTLLDRLLAIESALGRARPYPGAPRTVDLDLILFGGQVIEQAELWVPHPRFRDRGFVLVPLAQIAADMIDPVSGLTAGELCRRWCDAQEVAARAGSGSGQ